MNPASVLFKRRFGHPPVQLVRAPAPLTLLGGLAPEAEGLSLSVAVDWHVSLAAAPRTDGRIELIHTLAPGGHAFWLSNLAEEPDFGWASPIKAMLRALKLRGVHFSGFSAAIHDRMPSGFGSRSALECAVALLVRQMFPFTLTDSGLGAPPRRDSRTQRLPDLSDAERRQIGLLCRQSEPRDLWTPCDHFTPLFARAWQALVIDWQSGSVERWPFAGTAVVVCDAGAAASSQRGITEVRECLITAAKKLGGRSLRSVEPTLLKSNAAGLNEIEIAAVLQLVTENHCVVRGETALRDGDHRPLGQFLSLSHEDARDALQTVSGEADSLVKAASEHPACLGSRALFETARVATVSLVNYHEVEAFAARMQAEGERRLGRKVEVLVLPVTGEAG